MKKKNSLVLLLTTISLIFIISLTTLNTVEGSDVKKEKIYKSIQIEETDTLWSIANKFIDEDYTDINEYIKEIKLINNLSSDTIVAGDYIVIPLLADNESPFK